MDVPRQNQWVFVTIGMICCSEVSFSSCIEIGFLFLFCKLMKLEIHKLSSIDLVSTREWSHSLGNNRDSSLGYQISKAIIFNCAFLGKDIKYYA